MIAENKDEQKPEVCGLCEEWKSPLINPQTRLGMGPCFSKTEGAPFGLVTASFGSCEFFERKEEKKIIKVSNKLSQRISGG